MPDETEELQRLVFEMLLPQPGAYMTDAPSEGAVASSGVDASYLLGRNDQSLARRRVRGRSRCNSVDGARRPHRTVVGTRRHCSWPAWRHWLVRLAEGYCAIDRIRAGRRACYDATGVVYIIQGTPAGESSRRRTHLIRGAQGHPSDASLVTSCRAAYWPVSTRLDPGCPKTTPVIAVRLPAKDR